MRTTVNLDDEVFRITSIYASARGITLGAAIGELVRRAETAPHHEASTRLRTAANGLRVISSRGRVVTSEMVKAAQEDEIG